MIAIILDILKISIVQVVYALSIIVGFGLILGLIEKKSNEFMQKTFGWKGILVTGVIGTPIHEVGHLIMCLIFRHNVKEVKLLRLKESKNDGVLGYVKHTYNPSSLYQQIGNFFICIGPLVFGSITMFIAMKLLMGSVYNSIYAFLLNQHKYIQGFDEGFLMVLKNMFLKIWKELFNYNNLLSLNFWMFIFIIISIASHMALSKADIKGSISGIISIYSISLFLSIVFKFININMNYIYSKILIFNMLISVFLSVVLLFSFITLIINLIIYLVRKLILYKASPNK